MQIEKVTYALFTPLVWILIHSQLKKELVEATSCIATLKSELETARAKNKSDLETINIQQVKIESVSAKCTALKTSTKKCQDESIEKEKEMNALRYDNH